MVAGTERFDMSADGSLMADEDEEFIRRVLSIMAVWLIVTVIAGVALVLLRDPFAGLFAFAGAGL
ncbi:hypothetical protein EA462_05285 [Natrarchaeobius halalkaliphilus]|uniref:Uncharacterized protein n=2 Tax=Natrarchaeobius halalkaliphilus TaxID=1679091 RepID=A0A3N6LS90_9EURY|nr:hypothetical protein EA462_05285 [Natrarchaeobius halalkaliphilus]